MIGWFIISVVFGITLVIQTYQLRKKDRIIKALSALYAKALMKLADKSKEEENDTEL